MLKNSSSIVESVGNISGFKFITWTRRGKYSTPDGEASILLPSPLTGEGDYSLNELTDLGKVLRKSLTDAEQLLWKHLRLKQMEGLKFRRQQPIDNYIVDFVYFENRIIIEVDGDQHALEKEVHDKLLEKFQNKQTEHTFQTGWDNI